MFFWDQHFVCIGLYIASHRIESHRIVLSVILPAMPSFPGSLGRNMRVPRNAATSNYNTSALAAVQMNQLTQQQINLLQTHLLLVLDC